MNWWHKLKDKIFPAREGSATEKRSSSRRAPRVPSVIFALCSTSDDESFAIEITSISVSVLRLSANHPVRPDTDLEIRVPVGANFENRDIAEFVSFPGRVAWVHKKPGGRAWEAGIRYRDDPNPARDRWVRLVLDNYGLSTADERRRRDTRHHVALPVRMAAAQGGLASEGQVLNVSTGGLLIVTDTEGFQDGQRIYLEVGATDGEHRFTAMGIVVHAHFEPPVNAWYLGVRFEILSDDQKKVLVRTVARLSEKDGVPQPATGG